MKAEILFARSVIPTTQNPLAISSEQYYIALFMSCKSSLINGIGCTISLVSWFTRRYSIHNQMSLPLFLMITTIGETQGDVEGQIILAYSSPLIKSASFSRNLGATGRTLCSRSGSLPPRYISYRPSCGWRECVLFTNKDVLVSPDQLS